MKVTHRVINQRGKTLGYFADNQFWCRGYVALHVENFGGVHLKGNTVVCDDSTPTTTWSRLCRAKWKMLIRNTPFQRDIAEDLKRWSSRKTSEKQILMVRGIRQVGKTAEVLAHAYAYYDYVVYIDVVERNNLKMFVNTLLETPNTVGMQQLCLRMNLPEYVDTRKTVLILDEVCYRPEIYNILPQLSEHLNCDIICIDSCLSSEVYRDELQQINNIKELHMLPLSFKEFCWVFRKDKQLLQLDAHGGSRETDYISLTKLYRDYLQVGGFPDVVKCYEATGDMQACRAVQEQIWNILYRAAQYFTLSLKECTVFQDAEAAVRHYLFSTMHKTGTRIPEFVRNFGIPDSKTLVTSKELRDSVSWFFANDFLHPCPIDGQIGKAYPIDTGILSYLLGNACIPESSCKGLLAQTFVYNELYRLYLQHDTPLLGDYPSFSIDDQYNLTFIIQTKGNIRYGIVAKYMRGDKPKSLIHFLEKGLIDRGIVAEITRGGHGTRYSTIPIYTVSTHLPFAEDIKRSE